MLRTVTVTAATLAAAVVLAACGGSSGPNNGNNSSNSGNSGQISAAFHAAELKVSQCIRAHGVPNYPDPGSGSQGMQSQSSGNGSITVNGVKLDATPQTVQNAQKACEKYAPQAPAVSDSQLASIKQGAIKMAECMRKNGVPNFADPTVKTGSGGHGVGISIGTPSGGDIDIYSPAFKAARAKCSKLVPKP
jgi:hypothetical protein